MDINSKVNNRNKNSFDSLSSLSNLTPVTYLILGMISKNEKLEVVDILEKIVARSPSGIDASSAITMFIMIYLSYQTRDRLPEAFQTAIAIVGSLTPQAVYLLNQAFVDESVSMQSMQDRLKNTDINDNNDLVEFLSAVVSESYSGRH